ncbi:hypothetical protein GTQ34_02535 [Muricauda sp. JGD-17]|uniref:DUF4386 family protein n=1 Tax=Flagellimonas ochracea TaxID=2696472 RepID=A0A964T9N3_9FLAO|nr:hypothetical protein [Allomuricauda ochracea]NAY90784.1 hypothetical protein [Allomuricauda ochracea]
MKKDFETQFTGWSFLAAALMLGGGWYLSPHHVGEYLEASDFTEIGKNLWPWIWMYRIHIFGWVIMAISMFALASITLKKPYRVIIAPGAGMVIVGSITLAIASAFYYNFGAWGVGETMGKSVVEIQEFMDNILYTNQYVTCFVRFGRVFSGVGLVLLGIGLVKSKTVQAWLGWFTTILGLAAMGVVMGIPDNFEIYKPLFHIKVIWLALMGLVILQRGIYIPKRTS